eukprot:CAMPEP_0119550656 /NCGR_PEP_ID=MMETSP1352-20130426/4139_1 /TAXON_ID=265584 /ORGANISM="Stauroneis constricta, Strain CCMP1120" /LENGTH=398 /DNA_ID=CAMNT_0007596577 /DNA_START=8 /DNA_END=1204 /DNA_ORIENTATION=+
MCTLSPEETFGWAGAILANIGLVSLVSWTASTNWVIAMLYCAVYAISLFFCAHKLEQSYHRLGTPPRENTAETTRLKTDFQEYARDENRNEQPDQHSANAIELGISAATGDSTEDRATMSSQASSIVSLLYSIGVIAAGVTISFLPNHLGTSSSSHFTPEGQYHHLIILLVTGLPMCILSAVLWRTKQVPSMSAIFFISFQYMMLPWLYYNVLDHGNFGHREPFLRLRIGISVGWMLVLSYTLLSDDASRRMKQVCSWGICVGGISFFFDCCELFLEEIVNFMAFEDTWFMWVKETSLVYCPLLFLGGLTHIRCLVALAVLGFVIEIIRMSTHVADAFKESSAQVPITSSFFCLAGIMLAVLGYLFSAYCYDPLHEFGKRLQRVVRELLQRISIDPGF